MPITAHKFVKFTGVWVVTVYEKGTDSELATAINSMANIDTLGMVQPVHPVEHGVVTLRVGVRLDEIA